MSYHLILLCDTGWRRLIGSPKLQIIFHKWATKYRSLLRKMTFKDKASSESSPPCRLRSDRIFLCVYITLSHRNIRSSDCVVCYIDRWSDLSMCLYHIVMCNWGQVCRIWLLDEMVDIICWLWYFRVSSMYTVYQWRYT